VKSAEHRFRFANDHMGFHGMLSHPWRISLLMGSNVELNILWFADFPISTRSYK